jgi:hypothetical protein
VRSLDGGIPGQAIRYKAESVSDAIVTDRGTDIELGHRLVRFPACPSHKARADIMVSRSQADDIQPCTMNDDGPDTKEF